MKNAIRGVMARNKLQNLITTNRVQQHKGTSISAICELTRIEETLVLSLPAPQLQVSETETVLQKLVDQPNDNIGSLPQQMQRLRKTNDHIAALPEAKIRLLQSRQRLLKVFLDEEVIEQKLYYVEMNHLEEEVIVLEETGTMTI